MTGKWTQQAWKVGDKVRQVVVHLPIIKEEAALAQEVDCSNKTKCNNITLKQKLIFMAMSSYYFVNKNPPSMMISMLTGTHT